MENWKQVVMNGHAYGYEVSDLGRVRNMRTQRVLALSAYKGKHLGYQFACLYDARYYRDVVAGKRKTEQRTMRVAPMVATAFLGPKPAGLQIHHVNGDPADDRAVNLAYVTQSVNVRESYDAGRVPARSGRDLSPATHERVRELWSTGYWSQVSLGRAFGVNNSTISRIVNGRPGVPVVGARGKLDVKPDKKILATTKRSKPVPAGVTSVWW